MEGKFKMGSSEKKPCIQKRIKMWFRGVLFNPVYLFIFCVVMFLVAYSFLEILKVYKVLAYSYVDYLQKLEYSQIKDLVQFIVMADTSMFAFTGVIASMILKHVLEQENVHIYFPEVTRFKEKRDKIILFVSMALLSLVFSMVFGFGAIITQRFAFTIISSLIFLFTGFIEIVAMLTYSLGVGEA